MYGKLFASTYTGSMMGAGAEVFAVWGYAIANACDSQVELNPRLMAVLLGIKEDAVAQAIGYLVGPDARSRTPDHEGRRLIPMSAMTYQVVNHKKYREIKSEHDRREYNRIKQREHRERQSNKMSAMSKMSMTVNDSQSMLPMSAHTEAEAEENIIPPLPPKGGKRREKLNPRDGQPKKKSARPPDQIWDCVAEIWYREGVPKPLKAKVGMIVQELKILGATPAEIKRRLACYRARHRDWADTPTALLNHWGEFAPAADATTATGMPTDPAEQRLREWADTMPNDELARHLEARRGLGDIGEEDARILKKILKERTHGK